MSIEVISYNGKVYPKFQSSGNAARFIIPFAEEVLTGHGYDIGCGCHEWRFPSAFGIDPSIDQKYSATKLPCDNTNSKVNYIFSSHCLEHLPDWMKVLDYWISRIYSHGVIFLYLPDHSQGYWAYGNSKHVNIFTPEIIRGFMIDRGLKNIFVSGIDLNNSFACMAEIP